MLSIPTCAGRTQIRFTLLGSHSWYKFVCGAVNISIGPSYLDEWSLGKGARPWSWLRSSVWFWRPQWNESLCMISVCFMWMAICAKYIIWYMLIRNRGLHIFFYISDFLPKSKVYATQIRSNHFPCGIEISGGTNFENVTQYFFLYFYEVWYFWRLSSQ